MPPPPHAHQSASERIACCSWGEEGRDRGCCSIGEQRQCESLGESLLPSEPPAFRHGEVQSIPHKSASIPITHLAPTSAPRHASVLRPISYLGSKLRSIDSIVEVRNQWTSKQITVLDPFSGSSVVAQAFALNGDSVVCSDVMKMCSDIATATIRGAQISIPDLQSFTEEILAAPAVNGAEHLDRFVEEERRLIKRSVAADLITYSIGIPQIWRPNDASPALRRIYSQLLSLEGKPVHQSIPVVAAYYGGTYFGLFQALEIDRIWQAILRLKNKGTAEEWVMASLLTSLYSAASACTFTAGKHFAQPYIIGAERMNEYALRRVLEDRRIDVAERFRQAVNALIRRVDDTGPKHKVLNRSLEDWTSEAVKHEKISLIYADPPYTAQQYSRFYHILETLSQGCIPTLQVFRGRATRGIYPTNRFKSAFCSKRTALPAFERLLNLGADAGASVLLSYSFSGVSTGNARMIELEDMLSLPVVKTSRMSPQIYRLPHQYRSFTSTECDNTDDWEALILFTHNASTLLRK